MEIKRITIRITPELHGRLGKLALDRSVSLNTLAAEALEVYAETLGANQGQFPLKQLASLLAPAAEAATMTEEELLSHVREVRRRIWEERYRQVTSSTTT